MLEWEDVSKKFSHENKPLSDHIKEVKEIGKRLLDFYELTGISYDVLDYLAEYHDYGKRYKNWHWNDKHKPPHSPLSVKYLIDNRIYLKAQKEWTDVLWYLILKHHGSLGYTPRDYYGIKPYIDRLRIKKIVEKIDFDSKIDLTDLFGLFKLADTLSASNRPNFNPPTPIIEEDSVRKIIGKVDERWSEQLKLSTLPNVALLKAYTGWGKTSASLNFFLNKDIKKIFYLFPNISAINQFHDKLNRVFGQNVCKYFYFYDASIEGPDSGSKEELDLLNSEFMAENFLTPIIVTTIDQFLLSFLQSGKYYRKRVMFRNAGIILDEIHLLNPLMLFILVYILKKFQATYNFKFLAMSATFPIALKDYLMKELNLKENSWLSYDAGYKTRRRIMFEYRDDDIENHLEEINGHSDEKILIILNTVDKAIQIAKRLDKKQPILIHGRFMYKDRESKERQIEEQKKSPHILIATQVCEVSLDISYDYMLTELASITSLVQRFGRINRYGDRTDKTNVLIFRPDVRNEKYYPYTTKDLEISKLVINKLKGPSLSNENLLIEELDKYYTYNVLQNNIREASKEINIDGFEQLLQFFFSLSYEDEELSKILAYRESFTTLIMPHPRCIVPEEDEDKKTIELIKKIIDTDVASLDFNNKRAFYREVKALGVSVPIWWLRGKSLDEKILFPVVELDKCYSTKYGFRDRERDRN